MPKPPKRLDFEAFDGKANERPTFPEIVQTVTRDADSLMPVRSRIIGFCFIAFIMKSSSK